MVLATSVLQVLCKAASQGDVRQDEENDAHSLQPHLRGDELIRQRAAVHYRFGKSALYSLLSGRSLYHYRVTRVLSH